MRIQTEILVKKYQVSLYAAAFSVCRNPEDAEDAVQDTFLKYHSTNKQFESEQHIKAWLLRVVINQAKNTVMSFWRRNKMPLEDYIEALTFQTPESRELLEAVMALPEKYRTVVHLFYYEDASVREIAGILRLTEAAVKKRLSRGRMLLKQTLKEEWNDDE